MRTSNGQLTATEGGNVRALYGILFALLGKGETLSPIQLKYLDNLCLHYEPSKRLNPITPAEKEFIELVQFADIEKLIQSLKMIHDFALYHTDVVLDTPEKEALFDLKILWEGLEGIRKG